MVLQRFGKGLQIVGQTLQVLASDFAADMAAALDALGYSPAKSIGLPATASTGQVLTYNGTAWDAENASGGFVINYSGVLTGSSSGGATGYLSDGGLAMVGSAFVGFPVPRACTLSKVYVRSFSNSLATSTTVTPWQQVGTSSINVTNSQVTVPATTNNVQSDTTHTTSFAAGDACGIVLFNNFGLSGNTCAFYVSLLFT